MRGEFGVPVPQVRRWQVAEVAYDPENDDDADAEFFRYRAAFAMQATDAQLRYCNGGGVEYELLRRGWRIVGVSNDSVR